MPSLLHKMRIIGIACMIPHYTHPLSSVFLPVPQGYYSMHYLRPRDDYHRRCQQPSIIAGTGAYHQSFDNAEIARALFNSTQLTFAGSDVPNRQACWLRADDIGLAPDFLGTISFSPTIKNLSLDMFYHVNLTSWCEALFIEVGTTLVNARWHLCAREKIIQQGALLFPPCDMAGSSTLAQTARTIKQALSGCFFFGDMQVPWNAGRFDFETQEITRLADISFALGLDMHQSDSWTLSGALLTLIPTGNKFNATNFFSPLVGNTDHWELGITLQTEGCHSFYDNNLCKLFISATMTHQFKNIQRRTFDFTGRGAFSRYLLLKKLTRNSDGSFSYSGILSNAVNFATRAAFVRMPIHGDLVVNCSYQHAHLVAELGYHFYGRAAEQVCLVRTNIPCDVQGAFYGIKGTEGVCDTSLIPDILTACDLNMRSGSAPATLVHTIYFQAGHQWEASCMTPALLIGAEGSFGSYGRHSALCQWGFWIQLNTRF